jgi:selenophosphate synthetase-related protein
MAVDVSALARLRAHPAFAYKRAIQPAAARFGRAARCAWLPADSPPIRNGDDAAAIPDGDGFLLFAAEGMIESFLVSEPWFCGFSSVMVNVSDIAAMGGRPLAVVDVFWPGHSDRDLVFDGIHAATELFGVPVVGGHTGTSDAGAALAVSIVGRANRLITSFDAQPGHATDRTPTALRAQIGLLADLAEAGLVGAGKDISMGGVLGTALMLLECSGMGATLDLDAIPRPPEVELETWLMIFPSYGYLLAAQRTQTSELVRRFAEHGVQCNRIGQIDEGSRVRLVSDGHTLDFWDLAETPLLGFGA